MPDQFTKQLTPTNSCEVHHRTVQLWTSSRWTRRRRDADDTTFTGEVSLDQLTDAINEHFWDVSQRTS